MEKEIKEYDGFQIPTYICNTAVVGTGAAGYNAADRLWQYGHRDILIVTENRVGGTSRNTGSDKQTYYKLTLSGGEPDSVREMAETLFSGKCVDGDIALCEASLSVQCFLKLVELGVPFPRDRYGEYIGYKTDHDPRRRATSVGPYTSKCMTQLLEHAVMEKQIPTLDQTQVIKILRNRNRIVGLLCLYEAAQRKEESFCLICCKNIVYATGGPAGIYADSVYPYSQFGATGMALEAGAAGRNLTEWQYGLASVSPRWNVSGSYMQVLPRVYSVDEDGGDEREFLLDFFKTPEEMLSKLFLKGYQWPFDVRKIEGGSSIIDILVYLEKQKGRRVYLDYRKNPVEGRFRYEDLMPEVKEYLFRAGACFGTPFERLAYMNMPAIEFYRDKHVDLEKEPLEIALCAQHNNGGLAVDAWWRTNIEGLFAVGECAASHGVYRPGGTALNAGQVGSTRAAQFIAAKGMGEPDRESFYREAETAVMEMGSLLRACTVEEGVGNIKTLWNTAGEEMSLCAAAIRDLSKISLYREQVQEKIQNFIKTVKVRTNVEISMLFRYRDMLLSQFCYLSAMVDYATHGGKSRGSALYTDKTGRKPYQTLPDTLTFSLEEDGEVPMQEVILEDGICRTSWRMPHPIPELDDFFENVWRAFRENGNID